MSGWSHCLPAFRFGAAALAVLAAFLAGAQAQTTEAELLTARIRLNAKPADREARLDLIKLTFAQAGVLLRARQSDAALRAYLDGYTVAGETPGDDAEREYLLRLTEQALAESAKELDSQAGFIPAMEALAQGAPQAQMPRYLLGSALIRGGDPVQARRGLETLTELHRDGRPEIRPRAAHAGAAGAYRLALEAFRSGKPGAARELLELARGEFGEQPFGTPAQNQNFRYAYAKALDDSGETAAALAEYEALYRDNPAYGLANGTGIQRLLANALYKRAVEMLAGGDREAARAALGLLDRLESLEGKGTVDLHHARYLAFQALGDSDAANRAREEIRHLDPAYYQALFGQ
jgi:hypothetical protein